MTGTDSPPPPDAVIVGVGADGTADALSYAVVEARRARRPVHLLHVLQIPVGDPYTGIVDDMVATGRHTLDRALRTTEEVAGDDLAITAELVSTGWVVDELVRRAPRSSLLVMQHRAFGRVKRLVAGSVVQSVAGRARTPVISVPEGWSRRNRGSGVVTVAVQDPVEATGLLRLGLQQASQRGAALTVLHAWWLGSGLDSIVVDDSYCAERAARDREDLAAVLAPLRGEHPDVDVRIQVRHRPPAEAVLEASEDSDLLVIGRRHHLLPLGTHLGPVARASLAHSTCPVLITPEPGGPAEAPVATPEENQR